MARIFIKNLSCAYIHVCQLDLWCKDFAFLAKSTKIPNFEDINNQLNNVDYMDYKDYMDYWKAYTEHYIILNNGILKSNASIFPRNKGRNTQYTP